MSDSYTQSVEAEWDGAQRSIAGVNPFEPYLPALENLSAAGGSTIEIEGPQIPLWTLPQRVLVPQREYGVKTNIRNFHPKPPIRFAVGDHGGMSLQDAMDEKYEGLVGRDDGMFLGCDCTAISLRLEVLAFRRSFGIG